MSHCVAADPLTRLPTESAPFLVVVSRSASAVPTRPRTELEGPGTQCSLLSLHVAFRHTPHTRNQMHLDQSKAGRGLSLVFLGLQFFAAQCLKPPKEFAQSNRFPPWGRLGPPVTVVWTGRARAFKRQGGQAPPRHESAPGNDQNIKTAGPLLPSRGFNTRRGQFLTSPTPLLDYFCQLQILKRRGCQFQVRHTTGEILANLAGCSNPPSVR